MIESPASAAVRDPRERRSRTPRLRARRSRCIVAAGMAAALVACGRESAPGLTVGGVTVPDVVYTNLAEPERQMLFDLVALGSATSHGDIGPLVAPIVERLRIRRSAELLPYLLAARFMGADEEMLRDAYRQRPEWDLVVRHVVRLVDPAAPTAVRDSARSIAEDVAARARTGEDFAALAARFSEEPGADARGGLLQPGRRGSWVDPFWEAALSLQPGETSGVVESPYGYHVIRLENRRPVPFEEADRAALLPLIVPARVATGAYEQWMEVEGEVSIDAEALATARQTLLAGSPLDEGAVVARDRQGGTYDAVDIAASWALLQPEEAQRLERGDSAGFREWVASDAREVLHGRHAATLWAHPSPKEATDRASWVQTLERLAATFGFARRLGDAEVVAASAQALLSGTPERRAARLQLRTFRPLLRRAYPVALPAS